MVHGQPSAVHVRFQLAQLSALAADLLAVDPTHHLARAGQDKTPVQEIHALAKRMQCGLAVQSQTEPAQVLPDNGQAFLKPGSVLMNQDKVVHIADVIPDPQLLFDHVVHVVQHSQGDQLTDLTAQAYAAV